MKASAMSSIQIDLREYNPLRFRFPHIPLFLGCFLPTLEIAIPREREMSYKTLRQFRAFLSH